MTHDTGDKGQPDEIASQADPGKQPDKGSEPPAGLLPPPPPPPAEAPYKLDKSIKRTVLEKFDPMVKRTIVDLEACRDVVSKLVADKEVKVAAQIAEKGAAAPPEPEQMVDTYRRASKCDSQWEMMSGTDQYRLCSQCKLFLYDFTDVKLVDAQKLVMKREGKPEPRFYRRSDGKFLTSDCPVAIARGRRMLMVIAGSVVALIGAIAFMILMPKPEPAPTVTQESTPGPSGGTSRPSFDFGKAKQTAAQSSTGGYSGKHVDGTEQYRTNNSSSVVQQVYPWQRARQNSTGPNQGQYALPTYQQPGSNNNPAQSNLTATPTPESAPATPAAQPTAAASAPQSGAAGLDAPPPTPAPAPAADSKPAPAAKPQNPYVKNY